MIDMKDLLDSTDLKYDVDKDGDFRITVGFENGRSQGVIVDCSPQKVDEDNYYRIYAKAANLSHIQPEGFKDLLHESCLHTMGDWGLDPGGNLLYIVRVAASTLTPEALEELIYLTGFIADEKERALTNGEDRW
ncbi:MAG: hypothetical protein K6A35_02690 [bacterium]|nr:hypothetical protein [bacterium]